MTESKPSISPLTYTLKQLSELTSAKYLGDENIVVSGVADLKNAMPGQLSFLSNPKYATQLLQTKASIICVSEDVNLDLNKNYLISSKPTETFQLIAELFLEKNLSPLTGFKEIHPTAVIHPTAKIGPNVQIGPNTVIDSDVEIGEDSIIGPLCYVGPNTIIGRGSLLHASVTIREGCKIGNEVIIQPGVVIGSCGFGYTTDRSGHHHKLKHLAAVVIEDHVEIGANSAIDRGRLNDTIISQGTKIDNLVQIAHGVSIGKDNIIAGQTGFAGSSKTGKRVIIGGQVAINGHITLGDDVVLAAKSAVVKSIATPGQYGGAPAIPLKDFIRDMIHIGRIATYAKTLKELEKKSL